ncbi:hypothetical protein [Rhizobium rhododendri]|uniref:hypothetical protein n=1 Tax=Rhizobium rhododendri TaxID=2506430 RepID=UPI003C7EBBE1
MQGRDGHVINVASAFGEVARPPGNTLYIATKCAARPHPRLFTCELSQLGIIVNGVKFDPIITERFVLVLRHSAIPTP